LDRKKRSLNFTVTAPGTFDADLKNRRRRLDSGVNTP